jgi:hypothetical protein
MLQLGKTIGELGTCLAPMRKPAWKPMVLIGCSSVGRFLNSEDVSIYLECFGGTIVESPKFEIGKKKKSSNFKKYGNKSFKKQSLVNLRIQIFDDFAGPCGSAQS